MLKALHDYGFGILGKADLESLMRQSLIDANENLKKADSLKRAELLRISDESTVASVGVRARG